MKKCLSHMLMERRHLEGVAHAIAKRAEAERLLLGCGTRSGHELDVS